MTLRRAVRLLFGGTLFFTLAAAGAALYFGGLGVFAKLDVSTVSKVLAFSYQLAAFVMLLILCPIYWYRLLVGIFRIVSEVDPEAWARVPWFFRTNRFNAVYIPHALTPAGRQFRDEFLLALEGVMGVFVLAASLFGFALLGPDYFIGFEN